MMAFAEVRRKLNGLVQRRERQTNSLMVAYADIAAQIGMSDDWVRKFGRGDPRYGLKYLVAENIKRLCEHIEQSNAKMRTENAQAHQSNTGMSQAEDSASLLPDNDYQE